jgi:hypothetical protein
MKIEFAKVLERTSDSAELIVVGSDDEGTFAILTTLREGRDYPDGFYASSHEPVDPDWLADVHVAVDEQFPDLMAAEMARICG